MTLPAPTGRLAAEQLVYIPPGSDKPILRAVSFALEPGESLGVVGPSAAGKSSLANALAKEAIEYFIRYTKWSKKTQIYFK